jgi:UMF1 family MFS transporter
MPLFPQAALNEGVRRRELLGWALYDFANSGYTTVVLTAVFNAYFVAVVAGGAPWATLAWTGTIAVSSLIVMIALPPLGAWADLHGAKKRLLGLATVACVLGTVALAFAGPGMLAWAVAAVVVSNVAYASGESLIAAFLPELARPQAIGRVSGWGWSLGYLGGMLALGLSLAWVLWAQSRQQPATQYVPVTLFITAGIYALASLATFVLLRERAAPVRRDTAADAGFAAAWRRLAATWRDARRYRDFVWFLACSTSYQAGIAVVITLAAVYAKEAIGFGDAETMLLIFLVNIASAVGAFGFGYWQDRIGDLPALRNTLYGWILMSGLAVAATGPGLFWAAAVVAGLCMGSSQSAGRAMVSRFTPPDRHAEFYALWTWATRLATIVGPVTYGLMTWLLQGSHRIAMGVTALFFVGGLLCLRRVDLGRGQRAAATA